MPSGDRKLAEVGAVDLTQQRLATHVRLRVVSRPGISQESHLPVFVYCNLSASTDEMQMLTEIERYAL